MWLYIDEDQSRGKAAAGNRSSAGGVASALDRVCIFVYNWGICIDVHSSLGIWISGEYGQDYLEGPWMGISLHRLSLCWLLAQAMAIKHFDKCQHTLVDTEFWLRRRERTGYVML